MPRQLGTNGNRSAGALPLLHRRHLISVLLKHGATISLGKLIGGKFVDVVEPDRAELIAFELPKERVHHFRIVLGQ
jgi:hypothetical protein